MGSIAHPEASDAWDQVTLGPAKLPGVWTVEGQAGREIEVKKVRGKDGARFKDNGYDPGKLTLVGRMIEANDWNAMQAALKQIHPRQGKSRNPLALEHPAAAYLGITTVYVESVHTPRVENGVIVVEIDVLEWVEAPKVAKPKREPMSPDALAAYGLTPIVHGDGSITYDASGGGSAGLGQASRSGLKPSEDTPTYIMGDPG
jgi:hypothetical protein